MASPPPPRVVLVRHGRTDWNREGRFLGRTDRPLDEEGHRQAATVRLPVRCDRVVSSPLRRALETARYLGPIDAVHDGLRELDQGDLEGRTVAEAMASYPGFFEAWRADASAVVVPGGESLPAVAARARAAVSAVSGPGTTAVVTHLFVIAVLRAEAAGAPLSAWRRFSIDHGVAVVL